jgi:hypothetical protein
VPAGSIARNSASDATAVPAGAAEIENEQIERIMQSAMMMESVFFIAIPFLKLNLG